MAKCQITGKQRLVVMSVSHAHNRTKKIQNPNIQNKRFWLPEEKKWVKLKVSTRAIRSITKMGLRAFATKNGVNYEKLIQG
jgi:large subunit ribosomal protein L28